MKINNIQKIATLVNRIILSNFGVFSQASAQQILVTPETGHISQNKSKAKPLQLSNLGTKKEPMSSTDTG
jgi:oxalate decarboxylase/phosphoglucose isomerase-like protein (cupin superfamily)